MNKIRNIKLLVNNVDQASPDVPKLGIIQKPKTKIIFKTRFITTQIAPTIFGNLTFS